jgi:hypothetical protein
MTPRYILSLAITALVAAIAASLVLTFVAIFASRMMPFALDTENGPFILIALPAWVAAVIWVKNIRVIRRWFRNQNRILVNTTSLAEGEQILTEARKLAKVASIILALTTVSTILHLGSISTPWALTVGIATIPTLALLLAGATTFALTRTLANYIRDIERLLLPLDDMEDIGATN